eukprot:6200958-Alexandrium_andersonii.AAC.1
MRGQRPQPPGGRPAAGSPTDHHGRAWPVCGLGEDPQEPRDGPPPEAPRPGARSGPPPCGPAASGGGAQACAAAAGQGPSHGRHA